MTASGNEHHFPYPAASRSAPLNRNKTPLGSFRILMLHNNENAIVKVVFFRMQFMGIWPQVREKDIHYINTIYSYTVVKNTENGR